MTLTTVLEQVLEDEQAGVDDVINDSSLQQRVDNAAEEDIGVEEPGLPVPDPAQQITVGDATEYSNQQFNELTNIQFDEIMRVTVADEDANGSTVVGVRVTDHHGSFNETPTTANPAIDPSVYYPLELNFENGTASFTVSGSGEGADTDLVTLSFGSGLINTNDIETVGVVVGGTKPSEPDVTVPDKLFVESIEADSMSAATASTESTDNETSGGATL